LELLCAKFQNLFRAERLSCGAKISLQRIPGDTNQFQLIIHRYVTRAKLAAIKIFLILQTGSNFQIMRAVPLDEGFY